MKFKKFITIGLAGIISLSLISCGVEPKKVEEKVSLDDINEKVIDGNNTLGLNIFKELCMEDKGENIFMSPISISTALTMTYNGAKDNTKAEMESVLGYTGLDTNLVNESYKTLINHLENVDKDVKLSIGNSIWVREGEDINKEFININKDIFDAEVDNLDFSKGSSVDKINNWISKSTNGKITDMIKGPISNDVIMYLINAIYFKGQWQDPFDAYSNSTENFTTSEGEKISSEFMNKFIDDKTFYGEGEEFKAIKLPYDNGKISMYMMLPDENKDIDEFIKDLDLNKWNDIKASFGEEKQAGNVSIPKFEIEYGTKELNDSLINLGMEEAFTNRANFTGIGDELYISRVLHQAKIEVNEKGSEASAGTVVEMMASGAKLIEEDIKEFKADRPFLFIIADEESENILFMGKLETTKK